MECRAVRMCLPIPVEKRVAVAIWSLATSMMYRHSQELFGAGISTRREIVMEFCHSVEADLFGKVVCLGNDVGMLRLKELLFRSVIWCH